MNSERYTNRAVGVPLTIKWGQVRGTGILQDRFYLER